jgi:N6-L-threonylcarbamoyladenine synthase
LRAAKDRNIRRVVIGGGVAANGRMREVFLERGKESGIQAMFSSPRFCTDNGAMVAVTGRFHMEKGTASALNVKGYSRMSFRPC